MKIPTYLSVRLLLAACMLVGAQTLNQPVLAAAKKPVEQLYEAAKAGNLAQVKAALARGAKVDDVICTYETDFDYGMCHSPALYEAVENRRVEVVQYLLQRGANPNIGGSYERGALTAAVINKDLRLAELLLKHKANPNLAESSNSLSKGNVENEDHTPFLYALKDGNLPMVKLLLAYKADPYQLMGYSSGEENALAAALNLPSPELAQLFMQAPYKFDLKDPLYLKYALTTGHEQSARQLVQHGANINRLDAEGSSLLISQLIYYFPTEDTAEADFNMLESKVRLALELGANASLLSLTGKSVFGVLHEINTISESEFSRLRALFDARDLEALTRVNQALSLGKNLNQADIYDWPPLFNAIANQKTELCEQLLAKGADLEWRDQNQLTPLILAIYYLPELVPLLLKYGANPNAVTAYGSPLIVAATLHDLSSLDALLAKGADPNLMLKAPEQGNLSVEETALRAVVAGEDSPDVAPLLAKLMQAGADLKHKNQSGDTVLIAAAQSDKFNAVKFLLQNGADVSELPEWLQYKLENSSDPELSRMLL